jgi:CheY-like chemotaxis protein
MVEVDYILFAEDDEDDRYLIKTAFEEVAGNIKLLFVENGIELLQHFKDYDDGKVKRLPALMVVDINMPKKNGKEAIEELLPKDYFKKFPTVFFSTTSSASEERKCYELGINGYFVKPSDYASLLKLVETFRDIAKL